MILTRLNFASQHVWHSRTTLLQDAQKGRPARPQASQNRRRTLRGRLRIVMSRERSWRTFSASCEEGATRFGKDRSRDG